MLQKTVFIAALFFTGCAAMAQGTKDTTSDEMTLLFMGDIMGHGPQITSALDKSTGKYDYANCFKYIKNEMSDADYTIGNLEVTLAGPPYSGYPQFSSPDELAVGCQQAGVDILVTANNHTCDRGGQGITRTIWVLDSIHMMHTGSFRDSIERRANHPLIIDDDCCRIAILNYTYGTNGIPFPKPTIVNLLDKQLIAADMAIAKSKNVDKIIVITHWGAEYATNAGPDQVEMGRYIFEQGADIIIGAHPHVLQKMVWEKRMNESGKDELIVYSLGNFISNQRDRKKDGGAMFKMTLRKENGKTVIKDAGYILTWVYTPLEDGAKKYYVLPCSKYENDSAFFDSNASYAQMKTFISDSRALFGEQNQHIPEYVYKNGNWILSQ
jgi:poly-gamma-glutamate capsule biosynthesis protein CapA/YwtB (metallophosphatase superfamily)